MREISSKRVLMRKRTRHERDLDVRENVDVRQTENEGEKDAEKEGEIAD